MSRVVFHLSKSGIDLAEYSMNVGSFQHEFNVAVEAILNITRFHRKGAERTVKSKSAQPRQAWSRTSHDRSGRVAAKLGFKASLTS